MKRVLRNPWVRFVGLLLLILLAVRILYVIRGVLIPFALALIAAYIFDPVVDWLEDRRVLGRRIGRHVAIGLLVTVFAAAVVGFFLVAVPTAVNETSKLLEQDKFARIRTSLPAGWQEFIREWEESDVEGRRLILYGLVKNLFTRDGAVRRSLQAVALGAFAAILWVFQFILFFVVMVYLLLDIDRLRGWMRSALPRRYKDEILRISGKVDTNVKAFFRGQVVVVLVLSAIFSLGLLIIGCPFWYVVGVAGGLGAFIPYFALASGMVPAIVLTAIEYANPLLGAAAAAVVFAVGMTIDNVLVTPRIIGRSVGMHPVAVILSILIFGTLFGFLGVLFAVPIAAVVKVLAQELFARYRSSALYAAEPTGTIEPEEGA